MKIYSDILKIGVILSCLILAGQALAEEKKSDWATATREIKEAAMAIGNASSKSWQETKRKTSETFEEAKEKSAEVWDTTREKGSDLVGKTGEATGDVAGESVEKSKGFWQRVKEQSKEWLDKARTKIHELTAPKPDHASV